MTTFHTRIASGEHTTSMRRALLGGAAIAAFAAIPQTAFAQDGDQAETDADITEADENMRTDTFNDNVILVQARRQTETLQEVPVTVTVIGGDTIDKFNVDKVSDVTSRVPTLNVQVGGSGSGGQISLRGIGSSNISSAFDSAVAFDFDGVVVSTSRLVQAGFYDTAQIDVLKGPQSLFFGKSASAGVLSIRSADPTPDWQIGVSANYEFEEEGYLVNGFISGPLTDTLGIRLAAQYNDVDEFTVQAPGTPATNLERGLQDFVGRVTLDWEPLDRFRANLKLQYVINENDGALGTAQIGCGANGRADEIVVLGVIAIPPGYDCNSFDDEFFQPDVAPPLAVSVPPPSEAVGFGGVPFGRTDLFFGRLRFDLDFSDTLTLTSVSGYVDLDATDSDNFSYGGIGPAFTFGIPIDPTNPALGFLPPGAVPVGAIAPALGAVNATGTPLGVGFSDPNNTLEQFSQELRLTSDFDGPFNFMIGAFYETREFGFDTAEQAVNISLIAPDPFTGFTFDYDRQLETKTEAASVFGSVNLELTDRLELSGGLRYTDESKTQTITIPFVHAFLTGELTPDDPSDDLFVPSGFFSGPIDFDDDNFSPEVTLRYQATDDINVFASYKTGFKSGGIDNSALPSIGLAGIISPDPAVQQATADGLIFDSETTEGGEIGVKSQFADRTITVNATAYFYVFDDLQVQNFNATTIQFVTSNAGEVTTQGIDLEFGWRTPIDGLNISGSFAYLDAEYTGPFVQPGDDGIDGTADDVDLEGRRASQAPEFAGNVAVDWAIPIGTDFELNLAGNVAYNDGYFTDELDFDDFFQDSFWTLDANIGFGDADGKWRVSVIGVNLTDEIFAITTGGRPFLAPAGLNIPQGDDIVITQNRGRQVFVQGQIRF